MEVVSVVVVVLTPVVSGESNKGISELETPTSPEASGVVV